MPTALRPTAPLRAYSAAIGVVALTMLAGCAFPGSRVATVGVTCRVVDGEGRAAPGTNVVVTLPATDGLTGLDAVYGDAATYGHRTQRHAGVTDADGAFSTEFVTTHSQAFFVIPPLGTLLSRQTKPVLWLRVGDPPVRLLTIVAATDGGLSVRERHPEDGAPLDAPPPDDVTGTSDDTNGWRHTVTVTRR